MQNQIQYHIEKYTSLGQLLEAAVNHEPSDEFIKHWRLSQECKELASRDKSRPAWSGTYSFEDALQLAQNGWEEGRKIVKNYTKQYASIWSKFFPQQDFNFTFHPDVQGGIPLVEKVITGEPENMLEFTRDTDNNHDIFGGCKLQRIIVNCSVRCVINIETIYNRGALIAALVNSMEEAGFNVELNLVWQVSNNNSKMMLHILTIKKFTEQLDIDRLTFCVAHPSMFRRFIFSLKESAPDEFSIPFCCYGSYGIPQNLTEQQIKNFGIDINKGEVLKHGNMYFKILDSNYSLEDLTAQCKAVVKQFLQKSHLTRKVKIKAKILWIKKALAIISSKLGGDLGLLHKITGTDTKTPLELSYEKIITNDSDTIKAKDKAKKLANCDLPILILGETGTGKELFAQLLHGNRAGDFIPVNCGGIPDTLIEGEFFGSVKGAFTGAIDKPGLFEQAQNGTLFLDEIAELDRSLQAKLLRVIQEKKVRRLGDTKEHLINCRLVSATNYSVDELKNNSKLFRQDLFYRLAGSIIYLKPLRNRGEDIQLIADMISGIAPFPVPTDRTWNGNIRELINYIEEYKILHAI